MDSVAFLDKVKKKIKHFDKDAHVILFGSRARGDAKVSSDWDILILIDGEVTEGLKEKIRDELFFTELESEQVISSLIYSKDNWDNLSVTPFFQNVKKEGLPI